MQEVWLKNNCTEKLTDKQCVQQQHIKTRSTAHGCHMTSRGSGGDGCRERVRKSSQGVCFGWC